MQIRVSWFMPNTHGFFYRCSFRTADCADHTRPSSGPGDRTGCPGRGCPARAPAAQSVAGAPLAALVGLLGLDALLADLAGDGFLLGDLIGGQADALLGNGPGLHHGFLLVEGDLMFRLGDVRAGQGFAAVGVGNRLALDPDLFMAYGDGLLLLLSDDV